MLKKIALLSLISITFLPLCAVTTEELTAQFNHIKTEMMTMKRAWNEAKIIIKMAQKKYPTAYQSAQPLIEKIIASDAFKTKMDTIVENQIDAIANRNMSFASVKTDITLADFFPNVAVNAFMQKLFSAQANKACYLLLGQKLASKITELRAAIKMSQPQQPQQEEQSTSPSTTPVPSVSLI